MTLSNISTTSDPERGTVAERLARIDKFVVTGYITDRDSAVITIRAIAGSPFSRVELTYGRQYDRKHVGIDGLADARLTDLAHILLDEVEADLGIFEPKTIEVPA